MKKKNHTRIVELENLIDVEKHPDILKIADNYYIITSEVQRKMQKVRGHYYFYLPPFNPIFDHFKKKLGEPLRICGPPSIKKIPTNARGYALKFLVRNVFDGGIYVYAELFK